MWDWSEGNTACRAIEQGERCQYTLTQRTEIGKPLPDRYNSVWDGYVFCANPEGLPRDTARKFWDVTITW